MLLGGILTETLGWDWVLFVNTPIGLLATLAAPALIAESFAEVDHRSFDAAGAVSITAALTILVHALVDASDAGWTSTQTLSLLAASAALHVAFLLIERRAKAPLVPFSIFRLRSVVGANVASVLTGAGLFGMFFFITCTYSRCCATSRSRRAWLPAARGFDHPVAGLASQLVSRLSVLPVLAAGLVLVAVGLVWRPGVCRRHLSRRRAGTVAARRGRAGPGVRAADRASIGEPATGRQAA